jgi:DNA-binding NtrC family response regulator
LWRAGFLSNSRFDWNVMPAFQARPVVLVVEDETLVRMYAADILAEAGYEVIEAVNAQQALTQLNTRPDVEVVFTDINMPGEMNGFDLVREVHRRRPGIPVILTSGRMRPDRTVIPEIMAFVPKPYTAEKLTGLVNQVLA